MSDSLRDQLLKAGLVTRDQANRAEAKSRRKQKPRKGPDSPDQARERQLQQEIAAAERAKRQSDRESNRSKGQITHYFQFGRKVRQVMVTQKQQDELVSARLGIVVMDGITYLVDRALAEAVRRDDPDSCVVLREEDGSAAAEDDPYKDYQVPDDLQW